MGKNAELCSKCEIVGSVLSSYGFKEYEKICPHCKGTGKEPLSQTAFCERCKGKKMIYLDPHCSLCGGSGIVIKQKRPKLQD